MREHKRRLMIFSKAPVAGKVKTRLLPAMRAEQAAELYRYLMERQVKLALECGCAELELWCSPDTEHDFFRYLANQYEIRLISQHGDGLGERMAHAFSTALSDGMTPVLIGCDIPSLTCGDLIGAFEALESGSDAVFTPTVDGGYGLIGIKQANRDVFEGIEWGSDRVMAQTRARLRQSDWQWRELPDRWDIDRPEDLALLGRLDLPHEIGHYARLITA